MLRCFCYESNPYTEYYEFEGNELWRHIAIERGECCLFEGDEVGEMQLKEAILGVQRRDLKAISAETFAELWERLSKLPHSKLQADRPTMKRMLRKMNEQGEGT